MIGALKGSRPNLPARQVALEVVDRDYARLRPDVLRALRGRLNKQRWHWHFNDCDLDEYYNTAFETLYRALSDGVEIENRTGYLVRVAYNRAIDETRTGWRTHVVADELVIDASVDDDDVAAGDAGGAQHTVVCEAIDTADYAEAIDRRALVRHLRAQMKAKLTERECQAATLCLIQDWTRPQAARLLRIPEARMERIMDLVMRKLPTIAVPVAGQSVCPSRAATIRAYALGRLDVGSSRHGDAAAHVASCPECARFCASVGNLAAVLPRPVSVQATVAPHSTTPINLNAVVSHFWGRAPHLLGLHVVGTKTGASAAVLTQSTGGVYTRAAGGALLASGTAANVVATCDGAALVCLGLATARPRDQSSSWSLRSARPAHAEPARVAFVGALAQRSVLTHTRRYLHAATWRRR